MHDRVIPVRTICRWGDSGSHPLIAILNICETELEPTASCNNVESILEFGAQQVNLRDRQLGLLVGCQLKSP